MFDHEVPAVVKMMSDLNIGVFDHLDITSTMEVDQRVSYMQHILRMDAPKKYKAVLLEYKQLDKDLAEDKCTLGDLKGLSIDDFWTWKKSDGLAYDEDSYLELDKCVDFKN